MSRTSRRATCRRPRVQTSSAAGRAVAHEGLPENDVGTEAGAVAEAARDEHLLAVVIQQPNAYGFLEEAAEVAAAGSEAGAVVIGIADPMTLGLIAPPGEW